MVKTKAKPKAKPKAAKPKAKPKTAKPKAARPKAKPKNTMTELPKGAISVSEIEIIRKDADRYFSNRRIKNVQVIKPKILASPVKPAELKKTLVGAEVADIFRQGRKLVIKLGKNTGFLAVALGDGGQLRRHPTKDPLDPSASLVLTFTQGGQMRINDNMGDTKVRLIAGESQDEKLAGMQERGFDLAASPVPWIFFLRAFRAQPPSLTIKELLSETDFIVGLGDIYSDEVLYRCGLRYNVKLADISDKKIKLLLQAIGEILYEATKYRGTTLEDGYFCDLEGRPGDFQNHLNVYRRHGELTPVNMYEVKRQRFRGRWTYYCPRMQPKAEENL